MTNPIVRDLRKAESNCHQQIRGGEAVYGEKVPKGGGGLHCRSRKKHLLPAKEKSNIGIRADLVCKVLVFWSYQMKMVV